jgi:pyochelin synthetase
MAREVLKSRPEEEHLPFPLTDLQQGYCIGQNEALDLGDVSALANEERDLEGVEIDRLEQALRRTIERHGMLRARIYPDFTQQIFPAKDLPPFVIRREDLRGLSETAAEEKLLEIGERMRHRRLALDRWPLIDVAAALLDDRVRLFSSYPLVLADGGSLVLIERDWSSFIEGETPPPLGLSFRDCALALRDYPDEKERAASRDFWLERIDRIPWGPELPLVQSPSQLHGHRFRRRETLVPKDTWQKLSDRALKQGFTKTSLVLSVYAETLSLWSRSPEFSFIVLLGSRVLPHPDIANVVGNFSSPVIVSYSRSPANFLERARRFHRDWSQVVEHRYFSGVALTRAILQKHRMPTRALFPVTAVSGTTGPGATTGAAGPVPYLFRSKTVKRHLSVPQVLIDHQFGEVANGFYLNLDFVEEAFPRGFADDFHAAYLENLQALAGSNAPWLRPGSLPLPGAQLAARAAANATDAPVPGGLLHERVEAAVSSRADAPVLFDRDRALSRRELWERGGTIAARLGELGARPNQLVAVCMEKGWEQVAAALGVVRAGAAYIPIDPDLPEERRFLLFKESDARIVLTQPSLATSLRWPAPLQVCAVSDGDPPRAPAPLAAPVAPEDLAYVIFTSGSTGIPKGVMIDHRGAVNTIVDLNERLRVGPDDRVFAISSLSFDLSVYDLFGLLSAGGGLVLPVSGAAKDPAHWAERIEEHRVTIWNSVPTLMQMLVEHYEGTTRRLPPSLRLIMMSGDWIPVSLPSRIRRLSPDIEILSLGGATEASIWSVLYPIAEEDPAWRSIPYGRPMKNQQLHVLNEKLEPSPVGMPGDLYIGGVGLAKGYWRSPEKTASSFILHPKTKQRLYRTGDLGRYLPSGDIEFLGRVDFQVKIRGFRIELGDIESSLLQHPSVAEAVVVVRDRGDGAEPATGARIESSDRILVGYFVPRGPGVAPDALRAHLAAKLPDYMVPTVLIPLEAIPLTANGKVDRARLPAPRREAQDAEQSDDEMERELIGIWEEVLQMQPIGPNDNFFDLGGHSVLAVRMLARLRERLGLRVPLATLLQGSTVRSLCARLRETALESSSLVDFGGDRSRPPFFCVHPVSGSVVCYAELARELGAACAFFGLQSSGLLVGESPDGSVGAMADRYLKLVRQHQPRGPYRLGGWSMGGAIAVEMARELTRAGETVSRLAVIDALPHETTPENTGAAALTAWFLRDLLGILGSKAERGSPVPAIFADEDACLAHIISALKEAGAEAPFASLSDLRPYYRVFSANARALAGYTWPPYEGSVSLFLAEATADRIAAAWKDLAPAGTTTVVPGDHFSLMQPPRVAELARVLTAYLLG